MAFSDTQIQALVSLAEDACAKTYADAQDDKNRDGNPWKKYQEKADLKLQMFTSELKDMKLLLHKGVVIFEDMAPEAVLSFMWGNLEQRMTWDRQHQSLEMFPVIGQSVGNRTFVLCSRSKQVGPISPRDFCILITERRNENGSITQGGVSLLPEQPGHKNPKPKFVRGHCYPTGSVFERCGPNGKDCRVSHTTQVDLKGWFTTRVSSVAFTHTPPTETRT